MSNQTALNSCEDLIIALEECARQGVTARIRGACFDLERKVKMCRHAAREADRKRHVEKMLRERRELDKRVKAALDLTDDSQS